MAINLLIPDEWLRNFVNTDATPKQIEKYLSLCGPSVEKIERKNKTSIYHVEVTTNRVDSASVYGIAREAHAILPRFGIKTGFAKADPKIKQKFVSKVGYLDAKVDKKLCSRFTAVLIKNVKIKESPDWMKQRLEWVGVRPINNVVDISNYIMHEIGQPVHTFDYDKIKDAKMTLRKSKKGEKIKTLDEITYELPGGDIVIEDGAGRLIDLAGIMGGANSAVDENTKNVLLFVQTYDPVTIRRTAMTLPKRTEAVTLFEKGLDTELVTLGIGRGIELFEKLTKGKAEKEILDIYPNPYKPKKVDTTLDFIENRLGIEIDKNEIKRLLSALGFDADWSKNKLRVTVPSFRSNDVDRQEDILEEVARIYGYHNLPSRLMQGAIPEPPADQPFDFELKVKRILKAMGGNEIYTLSLVGENEIDGKSLKLANPLGKDSEYLRTSLMSSLIKAAKDNEGQKQPFHLFEIANVYSPRSGKLPNEEMHLGGIFSNYTYRKAKGVLETLLKRLNIKAEFVPQDSKHYIPSKRTVIKGDKELGEFGVLEKFGYVYYEISSDNLQQLYKPYKKFTPLPKYPAQIEDLTFILPERTKVADVVKTMSHGEKAIKNIELTGIYKDAYTFRIYFQSSKKTLTDNEVKKIRDKLLSNLKNKFGIIQKV